MAIVAVVAGLIGTPGMVVEMPSSGANKVKRKARSLALFCHETCFPHRLIVH